jgi:hypothetical protein
VRGWQDAGGRKRHHHLGISDELAVDTMERVNVGLAEEVEKYESGSTRSTKHCRQRLGQIF